MKRICGIVVSVCLLVFCRAAAVYPMAFECEGLGTRAITMGGAFTAVADDGSAIFYNPAGLTQTEGRRIEMNLYTMHSKIWVRGSVPNPYPPPGNLAEAEAAYQKGAYFLAMYPTEPDHFKDEGEFWPGCATMPSLTGYFQWKDYAVGYGLYVPLGNYCDWDDKIKDPVSNADIRASYWLMMGMMNGNISIAKEIAPGLSVGMGVNLIAGRIEMDLDKDYHNSELASQPDYEQRMELQGNSCGIQGVLGILYKLTPEITVGGMYKSGYDLEFKGETYARLTVSGVMNNVERTHFIYHFLIPPMWSLGLAYRPTSELLLACSWQRTDWTKSNWWEWDIHSDGMLLFDTDVDADWKPADHYHFGVEYRYTERLSLRAGFSMDNDTMPAENATFTTVTYGDTQYANVGMGYKWDVWEMDAFVGTMFGRHNRLNKGHQ